MKYLFKNLVIHFRDFEEFVKTFFTLSAKMMLTNFFFTKGLFEHFPKMVTFSNIHSFDLC